MTLSLLSTKLYVPPVRPKGVPRPRLIQRLDDGLACRLTLVAAPAGFGKTTLVSQWLAGCKRPAAWLSLDEDDGDPSRFLIYLIAALQTVAAGIGAEPLRMLQSSQPPPAESVLTALVNEISNQPDELVLVLDDYHVLDSQAVDHALAFLVDHQPPGLRLVIVTREDPHLPLARYRARGCLTELRSADLRFTADEAAAFLNEAMGLNLAPDDISALETRTEGWIAGLQLAAISMQAYPDAAGFIKSFSGSHRFVMDYLLEEVLAHQPEGIQAFLLHTSILERLCGPLCDAILCDPSLSGQETLERLEHANLFVVPLDNERKWYRYHHLFAELLRQRLQQSGGEAEYHMRASQWYEDNGLQLEAFRHAAAANDVDRAQRLVEGKGMGLHLPVATAAILSWLDSLPASVRDARPYLLWKHASLLLTTGQTSGVEERLQATETALAAAALSGAEPDEKTRDMIGKIAIARADLALIQQRPEIMLVQSQRALEYLHAENLAYRSEAIRFMGHSHFLRGDRNAAGRAYAEAISLGTASGDISNTLFATTLLAQVQVLENQLPLAEETYRNILPQMTEYSPPNAGVVHHGLAGIYCEWNDLDAAEQHGLESLRLARQYDQMLDRLLTSQVFLARLKLACGDVDAAAVLLAEAQRSAYQKQFTIRLPGIAAAQVLVLLRQGQVEAAAQLAEQHELPLSRARVLLVQGNPTDALAVLEPFREKMQAKGWGDEQLRATVLEALAHHARGDRDRAMHALDDALAMAEPGGFIRIFVDEGVPMAQLLSAAVAQGVRCEYAGKLLAAFGFPVERQPTINDPKQQRAELLTERELDVLHLIAQGLSNHEICERLFLALDTVKGHNRRIFGKLQVQTRTAAVIRARQLGLI